MLFNYIPYLVGERGYIKPQIPQHLGLICCKMNTISFNSLFLSLSLSLCSYNICLVVIPLANCNPSSAVLERNISVAQFNAFNLSCLC